MMSAVKIDNTVHYKKLASMLASQRGHSLYSDGNNVMVVNGTGDTSKLCDEPSGSEEKLWAMALKIIIEKSLFVSW